MADVLTKPETQAELGPVPLGPFAHLSVPCDDLEEGIAFYVDVLGAELRVNGPIFASFRLGGVNVGIGINNVSFIGDSAEYPHMAFYVDAKTLVHMKDWLAQCGVPTSNLWTRNGVEALMFFRDPFGNVIELFCTGGYEGAKELPRGPSAAHGIAVDIDALRYSEWKRPKIKGSRVVVPD